MTRCPPTRRAGTPRRRTEPLPSGPVKAGSSTSTGSASAPARESAGVTPSRSRFHRPSPDSAYRNPIDPLGTTGAPLDSSSTTVFQASSSGAPSERSAAVRNLPGTKASSPLAGIQADEERQVGVGPDVVVEEGCLALDEVLGEEHVTHRHGECGVRPGLRRHPLVGELGVVGVVRADRDDLGPAVADLGHPVGVGRTRDRDVGAPHHQVGRVPPVAGLGDVGLVAEDLGAGHGQVGVPVVERRHHAADELDEPGADAVRHHRHRRDRREAGDAVGAVRLDRVDVGGGGDLDGLAPAAPGPARPCRGPAGSGAASRGRR